jgi:TolB protein
VSGWRSPSTNRSLFLVTCGLLLVVAAPLLVLAQRAEGALGTFESQTDVGTLLHPSVASYDAAKRAYTITASGNNMWSTEDDFHFVWTKMSGDIALSAEISILGQGGNLHKKGVLMIRQSLDPDSVYVDVALHANGLTALQFRDEKGAVTHDIEMSLANPAPKRLRLDKHGDFFYMTTGTSDSDLHPSGASIHVAIKEPFYVGIGMCAHDKDVLETGIFTDVEVGKPSASAASNAQSTLYSTLETIAIDSTDRHIIYSAPEHFEAPNWTHDGASLIFNRDGRLLRIPIAGGTAQPINTGFAILCNNDHGLSPDATQLAVSDQSQEDHKSLVYIVPAAGGTPRRITKNSPSYWHGWSPDGKTLAFVGERSTDPFHHIYTIPVTGGPETQLTTNPNNDDGPEYSPDGSYIYFNSERTGAMQIWRMRPDGTGQEQVISDETNDWFPHISPDGKWMVFLSYAKDVKGHPPNHDVALRLMSLADNKITVLAKLFGGQGTINVPSWAPDSKHLAFVSYQLVSGETRDTN